MTSTDPSIPPGTRLLLVEDETTIRHEIVDVLGSIGYDVTEASTADQALELFEREPFALILTDIVTGGMSGLDLLEAVKRREPDTVVVVMTSNASLDAATRALRAGAYDFLTKPFEELDIVSSTLGRALEQALLLQEHRRLVDQLAERSRQLESLNATLRVMAARDGMTGLYNQRHFMERLAAEVARAERHARSFSLVFMDVDHFKKYNDAHGHPAGDELLKSLASSIKSRSRTSDFVARYGGEEFVAILFETDKAGAARFAEDVRSHVEQQPYPGRERQPLATVSLSLGVAAYPDDADDPSQLIDRADKALYQAKAEGRNRVVVWGAPVTSRP